MNAHPPNDLDYYAVLGVAPDASLAEIKQAYRARIKRCHPDKHAMNPTALREAERMTRALNRAYAVLSDSQQRARYDELRWQQRAKHTASVETEHDEESGLPLDYGSFVFTASPGQHWLTTLLQWLSARRTMSGHKQLMGAFSKMLLAPIPFCLAIIVSSLFWKLGSVTNQGLFLLSAVLAYPLILVLLLVRIFCFPIRYRPLLSLRRKLIAVPVILIAVPLLSWLWIAVVDRQGAMPNPLDLYWWCSLILVTCVGLAYL